MCVGHAAFTARPPRPGLASSSHSFVERRISEPVEHHHKFAGLFCVLLVGQFTISMFGIECFVNGVQGAKHVANHLRRSSARCVWRRRKFTSERILGVRCYTR